MAGQWRDPFTEKKEVFKPNPKSLDGVPDLCMLTYLAEENVLHNLGYRYKEGKIYTSTTSKVLIAVNPYERMDSIYTEDMMKKYQAAEINLEGVASEKDLPPHVFTVANAAYNNLIAKKQNQSIIVCGESGSGKTESAKYQMRFLAFTSTSGAVDPTEFAAAEKIGQQVLDANPILESFGNAKTLLNNNSSRFGKFTKMLFEEVKVAAGAKPRRKLIGAAIDTYLLEKSRVVRQDKGERNFHIFYQLTTIYKDKPELKLGPSEQFHYVNQSGVNTLDDLRFPGKAADAEWHKELTEAWGTLLIAKAQIDDIYKTVSGILHIGNVNFEQLKGEGSDIKNKDELVIACEMFGVPEASLEKRLKTRSILLPGDKLIVKPLNEPEAIFNRDSVSRNLYNGLFRWIVNRINQQSNAQEGPTITWIGILDVFGFEIFDHNSFEQFCINFANERLQQYFNEHVLKAEQDLYKREALLWDPIDLPDNQDCIDLVMSKPYGILPILDSTCVQPKGTDVVFTANLFKAHKYHPRLRQVTQHKKSDSDKQFTAMNGFVIRHYAGAVIYDCAQFLEKNADASEFDTVELFMESKSVLQSELLRIRAGGQIEDGKRSTKRAFLSTGTVFSDQLQTLMATLKQTSPYFVRCIKPNKEKSPKNFEGEYVRPQLRCGGLIEALRIIKLGFPTRCAYKRVHEIYQVILKAKPITNLNQRDFTEAIMSVLGDKKSPVIKSDYQLGLSMVFFRPGKQTFLTDILEKKPEAVTADETKQIRKFMVKKRWIRGRGTVRALIKTGKMLSEMRFKKAAVSMVLIYRAIGRYLKTARNTINGKLQEADDERKKRDLQFQAALRAAEDLKKLQKQKEEMDASLRKQAEENQRLLAEKDAAMEKQEQRLREFMEKLQESNNKNAEMQKKQLGLHQSSKEREQELNSRLIEVGAEKDRAQAQVRTLEGQVAGKGEEITQKDRVIAERQGAIDGLKRDIASLKEQMDQASESSDGALTAKTKELKDAKEAFETEQSRLQGEIKDKEGELERLKGDLMNSEGKQRDLREQIERQGRSNDEKSQEYDRQLSEKDRQIAALQAEIESLKKRLEEAKTQAEAAAKAASDALKQARQEAKDQQAKMDRAISDKESEISRLQNELAVLRASMESQSKNNAETLSQEREESRDRAEKQEKQLAEKDADLNRVKRELALTSGKLDAALSSNHELTSKHSSHVHETAEKLQEAAEKHERLIRKTDAKLAEAQSELALYKDRLENASRELKATSQRNDDNMAVLDRQLKDKETALAELKGEFRKLQARLDTLTSTSGDKVALLQEQLNARRTEQRETQAKFEKEMWEKNRELGEVKSEVEVLRGRLAADRERFDTEKKLFDDQLAQSKNDSASRLESLDQELKSRNGDLAELKGDYKQDKKEWKEKQEKFEKQVGDLEKKIESKEDEIVAAQAKLSLLEKTSKQAAEEAQNQLQKAISKNQSAGEDWKSQERELSGQVSFLTEERRKAIADLETERTKIREQERKHREDLEKKRSDYDRLEKEFVSYRGEVGASNEAKMTALAGQVQTLQTMLDDEKHDKEEAKKRESEYRERMKDASSQLGEALSELKHIQTTHGTELEKLRLELETAREKHVLESQAWKDQADAYERQVIEKTSLVNELKADLSELSEREAAATGALKQKSLGSRDELRKLKMQNEEYEFEQKNWLERQAAYEARLTKSSIDLVEAHSALAESERKLDSAIQDLKVEVEVLQAQLEAERKASHDRETDFDRELKLHKERFAKELSRVTSQAERDILMREQRLKTQEDTYKYRIQYLELAQKHSQQRQQQQSSS